MIPIGVNVNIESMLITKFPIKLKIALFFFRVKHFNVIAQSKILQQCTIFAVFMTIYKT